MDDTRFDDLVRRLTLVRTTRMATLRGMAGSIPAALTAAVLAGEQTSAKKKRKKHKKKRRRSEPDTTTTPAPTTTTPPVTTTTTTSTTTTSTTAPPGACTVEQNSCVEAVTCNGKPDCICWIRPAAIAGVDTPFCGGYGRCFNCSSDIECEGAFGAGWVCLDATGPHCEYCEVNYNGRQCAPPCGP